MCANVCDGLNDPLSCQELISVRQTLLLSPRYLADLNTGIKQHLHKQLLLHSDKFDGVPLRFNRVQRLQSGASIVSDEPHLHVPLQVEAVVFRPKPGKLLSAVVNKVGHDHIGCLVHGHFNASLPRLHTRLRCNDQLTLQVLKVHTHNGVLSIDGSHPAVVKQENESQETISSSNLPDSLEDESQETLGTKLKKKKKKKKKLKEEEASWELPRVGVNAELSGKRKRHRESSSVTSQDSGVSALFSPEFVTVKTEVMDTEELVQSVKKHKKKKRKKEVVESV